MDIQKNAQVIQSLQTGMQIIELIAEKGQSLKFNEIQELSGITKSNLYKYLNTLTQLGLLYRDKKHGTYTLGSKLIEYGIGKIFVTFMESVYIKEWRLKELSIIPDNKRKELEEEQKKISQTYFASTEDPLIEHVSSISVPIFDYKKELLGALTVVGFTPLVPKNS